MKTHLQTITPVYAAHLLKVSKAYIHKHKINRRLSSSALDKYTRDMRKGDWRTTHQGILLGKNGIIIDGYHRLTAVVASGVAQEFLVSMDESLESPKDLPIDIGFKRTNAFILGIDKTLSSTAAFIGSVVTTHGSTTVELGDIASQIKGAYNLMMSGSDTHRRGVSAAPVIAGGVIRVLNGEDVDYIASSYEAMRKDKFSEMSPLTSSFYKQIVVDRTSFSQRELFTRAYRAFDKSKAHVTKVQIKDMDFAYAEAEAVAKSVISISK